MVDLPDRRFSVTDNGETCIASAGNYQLHFAEKVYDLAEQNGVVLLPYPPHASHKLENLDRSVHGDFKNFENTE
jgi:hypothetical protein